MKHPTPRSSARAAADVPAPADAATGPAWLQPHDGGVRLRVHVQPGARRSAVVGPHGDRLKIALRAPPVDGKANAALCELVAELLDLPQRAVTLVAGTTQRDKTLAVAWPAAEAPALAAKLLAGAG